ncbi:MAG: NAD-dependent epimerase/dehydratase family protein [Acidimicrobiia bacterium]|nr:NAD-dependent epimerase/dehydratase family protein [Acidimicrobiia bacterium]
MNVTVLGGRGLLGSRVSRLLEEAGHEVLVASRSAATPVDMASGHGLRAAVEAADAVIHLASDPRRPKKVDVGGTRRLVGLIEEDQRLIYASIVGVDRHPFGYYKAKHDAERIIAEHHEDHVILRATQFHDFVAFFIGAALRPMVALIPKNFVFQPVDTDEVASRVAGLVHTSHRGLLPDFAGPEVLTAEYLARSLLAAQGKTKPILNLPVPGKAAAAFRAGLHTNPDEAVGVKTWDDYLRDFTAKRG